MENLDKIVLGAVAILTVPLIYYRCKATDSAKKMKDMTEITLKEMKGKYIN